MLFNWSYISFYSFLIIIAGPLLLSLLDFITLVQTRMKGHVRPHRKTPRNSDIAILVPIFGKLSYLKNIDFLKYYARHVVLCTTTKESRAFNEGIEAIAKKYGFRIFRSDVPIASKNRPNPWGLFKNTLHEPEDQMLSDAARDEIIRDSFSIVKSAYCVFLDGDTTVKSSLYKLAGIMAEKEYDIASVRILVSRQTTLMEKLQAVEYELAMDARKMYPWLTSGAGMIAKTSVIREIMAHHSLFFSGGDIEIGRLAKMLGHKVGHIAVEFLTDVPKTFGAWCWQRIVWCGGSFRHAIINLHSYTWRHPFFYLYYTVVVWLLMPLRWWEIFHRPMILLFVIFLYWALITVFHWKRLRWYYILFPLYSLFQVMILVPMGFLYYVRILYYSHNIGFIRLRGNGNETWATEDIGL